MSKIENLTPAERMVLERGHSTLGEVHKALRIIDQLTAALEAAERGWEQDVKAAAEAIQKKTKCVELAELSATAQRCAKEQAELADLRGRVERALTVYSYFEIDLPAEVALRRIAEVLRGR